LGVKV